MASFSIVMLMVALEQESTAGRKQAGSVGSEASVSMSRRCQGLLMAKVTEGSMSRGRSRRVMVVLLGLTSTWMQYEHVQTEGALLFLGFHKIFRIQLWLCKIFPGQALSVSQGNKMSVSQ